MILRVTMGIRIGLNVQGALGHGESHCINEVRDFDGDYFVVVGIVNELKHLL